MIPVIHFRTGGQQPGNKLRPIPLQRRNQSRAFKPVADIDIRSRLKQFLQYFELSSLRRNRQNGLRPVILIFLFDIGARKPEAPSLSASHRAWQPCEVLRPSAKRRPHKSPESIVSA